MHRLIGGLFLLLLLISSCRLIDKPEEAPSYLKLENPLVEIDSTSGQKSSLGLKDFWVYQNGLYIGTFEKSSVIPYFPSKGNIFSIQGGIYESGISGFRINYPFWKQLDFQVDPTPLDTNFIEPLFTYRPPEEIVFSYFEGFEDPGVSFSPYFINDTAKFFRSGDNPFSGNYCGKAIFDSTHAIMSVFSAPFDQFATKNVFVEITYQSDFEFWVGLQYDDPATKVNWTPVIYTPKPEWNTTYIHLIQEVTSAYNNVSNAFRLMIQVNGNGQSGVFKLDNVRVIREG